MDISQYILEDTYNEFPVGEDLTGVCARCDYTGYVRVVVSRDYTSGKIQKIGPFDRKCAYELKIGEPPPYNTMPSNAIELIYRFVTKEELPSDRYLVRRTLWRLSYLTILFLVTTLLPIALVLSAYWWIRQLGFNIAPIWLIGIFFLIYLMIPFTIFEFETKNSKDRFSETFHETSRNAFFRQTFKNLKRYPTFFPSLLYFFPTAIIGLIILIPLFMIGFILFFLVTIFLPFAVVAILLLPFIAFKQVRNYLVHTIRIISRVLTSKNVGHNHIEHFELFWDGKVSYETKSSRFYRHLFFLNMFTLLLIVLYELTFPNFSVFLAFSFIFEESLEIYNLITTLDNTFLVIFTWLWLVVPVLLIVNALRRSGRGYFIKYYPMPYDIHLRILDEYEENLDKEEIEFGEVSIVERLLNSLRFTNDSVSKLSCMICKTSIERDNILSKCPICKANYHEDHLEQYIQNQHSNGKSPTCAVCKYEFVISQS